VESSGIRSPHSWCWCTRRLRHWCSSPPALTEPGLLPGGATPHGALENVLGSAVPAFIGTALISGKVGVRGLARRSFRCRVPLRWYLISLLAPPLILLIAVTILYGLAPLRALTQNWLLLFTVFLPALAIMILLNKPIDHWLALQQRRLQVLIAGLFHSTHNAIVNSRPSGGDRSATVRSVGDHGPNRRDGWCDRCPCCPGPTCDSPQGPTRQSPTSAPTTTNVPTAPEMAYRLRRTDQQPQARLRMGSNHDRHHRWCPDLDRTRNPRPQPGQDQRAGRLTPHPRTLPHPGRPAGGRPLVSEQPSVCDYRCSARPCSPRARRSITQPKKVLPPPGRRRPPLRRRGSRRGGKTRRSPSRRLSFAASWKQ
jgi:hypothetical protein